MNGSELSRFEAKVKRLPGSCWLFTGATGENGYGRFFCGFKPRYAHHVAYEHWVGEIPDGMEVMHQCDVRNCVNPAHLSVGTHAENMRQLSERGGANGFRSESTRGEQNPKSKLTTDQIREIRRRAAAGEGRSGLAKAFGVTTVSIGHIVNGRTWKHIPSVCA